MGQEMVLGLGAQVRASGAQGRVMSRTLESRPEAVQEGQLLLRRHFFDRCCSASTTVHTCETEVRWRSAITLRPQAAFCLFLRHFRAKPASGGQLRPNGMPQGNLCYYCFRAGRSKPYTELQTKDLDKRLAADEDFKRCAGLSCTYCAHLHGSRACTHLPRVPSFIVQASSHCQRAS